MKLKRYIILLVAVVALVVFFRRGSREPPRPGFDPKAAAKVRLEEVRGEGIDVSAGPCLGLIGPDWVADVVHDPRQPVDEIPQNQCAEYRAGTARHFVELTPLGKIIRVK